MIGFYNIIGRAGQVTIALALLMALAPVDTQAQIAFPENALARAVAFTMDGADEVQLVGTHSFGMYRSVPGAIGKNRWVDANNGLSIPLVVNDIFVLSSGTVLMGAAGSGGQQTSTEATGLFTSGDGGLSWTTVEKSAFDSLAVHTVQAIAESTVDNVVYISADDGNIFISQNGGSSWVFNGRLPGGSSQTPWSLLAHPTIAGTVYAGTFGYGVYVSTDNGAGWLPFTDNATLFGTGTCDPPTDTTGCGWRPDGGGNYVFDLEMNPASDNQMFAATAKGVWRMDDVTSASGTWTRVAASDSSFTLIDLSTVHAHPEVRSIAFDNAGTTLYQATWGFGVLTTTGFSGAPSAQQIALRGEQVSVVGVSPSGAVFAGTASGITQIVAASATDTAPGEELPDGFLLQQNYPNPFNPSTSISFELPAQSQVSLTVFDMLGRQVAELAQGTFQAGLHAVTLDASRLQSGLYIYRLDAGDHTLVRTMSLVK